MIINYSRGEEPYTIHIGEDDRVGILMLHSKYKCTSIKNENLKGTQDCIENKLGYILILHNMCMCYNILPYYMNSGYSDTPMHIILCNLV